MVYLIAFIAEPPFKKPRPGLFYRIPADFTAVCPFNLVLNTLFGLKVFWNCSSDWFKEIVYGRIGLLAGGPMPVESFLFVYLTV